MMIYNWDGDIIVQESIVEKKRYVIGSQRPITTDIREFVSPADDVVIKGILGDLAVGNGLPTTKNPGDFDKRAMIIWDHVAKKVEYRFDAKEEHGDFWFFPSEVHTLSYGDCEDGSFLLASLLIGSGISPFNVRVVLGELLNGKNKSLGGHCWPMYKNEAGRWCILESTFDRAPWGLPTADRFTSLRNSRYVPHFCFNNFHLWAIRHEEKPHINVQEYLEKNSKQGALANLQDPKFPSGGFLSTITGDTSPGHLELTSDALAQFGFSEDAISIAGDAAQDPDFYEWYNAAAHAQTNCALDTGATSQSETDAINAYLAWCVGKKDNFLSAKTDEHALFFLGYLLHGVQDLASHQGVTNSQHAYESYILCNGGDDCDHLEANRQLARQISGTLLGQMLNKRPGFAKKMENFSAGFSPFGAKIAKGEKCRLLGKKDWDLSIAAYKEYKGLAKKYEKVKEANPVKRWDRTAVFNQLLPLM
jgi:hypothetical protein